MTEGRPKQQRRERVQALARRRADRPLRLLFQRFEDRSIGALGAAATIDQLREELRATSINSGNLVHLEAMPKLLRYDRRPRRAGRGSAPGSPRGSGDAHHDGIVLGYANMIRAYDHLSPEARDAALDPMSLEAERLAATPCRIFAFGIGIQDGLEPRADAVDPRLFALLKVLNDRAEIFGVRGHETEAWLHAVGLTRARALGCPSMFVYPHNVMRIRSPATDRPLRIATAGRLQRSAEHDRLEAVTRIGAAFSASYVFQSDFYAAFRAGDPNPQLFDDATGEVSRDAVLGYGERLGVRLTFDDYFMFRSTEKWRGFALGKDAYFGDRFHGGVVFMQTGRPAIIVQNDDRVKELTGFYDLPTATSAELIAGDPVAILHDRLAAPALERMRAAYARRYRVFYDTLRSVGLDLFNDITPDTVDAHVA